MLGSLEEIVTGDKDFMAKYQWVTRVEDTRDFYAAA